MQRYPAPTGNPGPFVIGLWVFAIAQRKPNGRAPAWKATTVQRVWAGIAARVAGPAACSSGLGFAYGQN